MKIVALVPAHNEASSIATTIEGLIAQDRSLDEIVVIADNCTDDTVAIASRYPVTVHETVGNSQKKPGALNEAWRLFCGDADLIVCIDADTVLPADAVRHGDRLLAGHLGGLHHHTHPHVAELAVERPSSGEVGRVPSGQGRRRR